MKEILEYLPVGWEAKAKELGAFERAGVLDCAEELFRLNMLYVSNDGSLQSAAIGMALTTGKVLSKVAVHKRIKKSGSWLRWIAQSLCESQGFEIRKPDFLGDKQVKLVDASDETTKGKNKKIWRLHYVFNLFEFQCASMELTDNKEGERLTRHKIAQKDIIVADRIYCTMSGIEHVSANKGDYLLRFKSKAFNLHDETEKKVDLLSFLKCLNPFESVDLRLFYKLQTGELRPIRIIAMKKDEKAVAESKRKIMRKVSKKQEKTVQEDTLELNEYVVLATSLDYSKEQILELYRARWQVEQVFYRLKSLFGYGDLPSKREDTVKAWFYGKLLLAALCENILKRMPFPPEIEPLLGTIIGAQFMG
jgi:hypothetical protein